MQSLVVQSEETAANIAELNVVLGKKNSLRGFVLISYQPKFALTTDIRQAYQKIWVLYTNTQPRY